MNERPNVIARSGARPAAAKAGEAISTVPKQTNRAKPMFHRRGRGGTQRFNPQSRAPAGNWVCFPRPPATACTHKLFKEPGLRSFLPFPNWVCFARFDLETGLRSYGRHPGRCPPICNPQSPIRNRGVPRPPEIGFVSQRRIARESPITPFHNVV
jgi:hypothetical protein